MSYSTSYLPRTISSEAGSQNSRKFSRSVEIAENGSLAVDAYKARVLQSKPFDIILMGVSMPFTGAMEATELIRSYEKQHALPHTPIIALTAHAMIGDRLQAGTDDHITKGIETNRSRTCRARSGP
ncbi:hypothetical protein M378DRAFT_171843 [Amanita muscaria Koide BX008]|uniref:Response regulatory domain-containing protein n=1 Tax=Amanita muscaria (strain Koide BX008) TaxID=946122 RepID=A0A0C2S3U0_AMAMK|nr:hypothetical protein M378DRAFT_171843 [Amanita muscaria Koide BX008]